MTGASFQFAARRLRVFDRGVFHLGFAIIAFHLGAVASATRVFILSTRRAQAATVFAADQPEGQCRRHELTHEVTYIEIRAAQNVVVTEGITRSAGRIESLVDVDADRDDDIVQTSIALAGGIQLDRTADMDAFFLATHIDRDMRGAGESNGAKRRNLDRIVERYRPSCVQ